LRRGRKQEGSKGWLKELSSFKRRRDWFSWGEVLSERIWLKRSRNKTPKRRDVMDRRGHRKKVHKNGMVQCWPHTISGSSLRVTLEERETINNGTSEVRGEGKDALVQKKESFQ